MSQNDFNLANQGFPAMRADMNSAFQALASNSSGATEPGTTYAYQWWYDETTDILKIRNADDDAWINIASFDQANDTWSPYVGATALTATGAELNLLDGATVTTAEINQLDADNTGALKVPTGTVAERPTPAQGQIRFNSDDTTFEGYDGTSWGELGGSTDFSAVAEDIIPDADSTRDLGSSTKAWALAYIDAIEPVGADTTIKRVSGTNTTPIVEGIAKAWVNFNGTGTIAARDSLNVSSLTDNGTGDYTVNFTNAFGAADYIAANHASSPATAASFGEYLGATPTTTALRFGYQAASTNLTDFSYVFISAHGDLA